MSDKYLVEIEGSWQPMTLVEMLEAAELGNDLKPNRKRCWTGLKDKNGVEIYEGDIVAYKADRRCIFEVKFGKRFIDSIQFIGWNIDEPASDYEVIGNIYENPELLEVKSS